MIEEVKPLNWVITEYGNDRLTEMLSNPEITIKITKLLYGTDNSGSPEDRGSKNKDGIGKLIQPVGATGIYEKGLDKERPNTVYFKSTIDENVDGFNIKELALVETVETEKGPEDRMFAIGIGEPIVKPSLDLGYIITVDYTVFLESINLYKVYDQVVLDPDNEFLKEEDIEDLHKILLFSEGNLIEQINNNTHILGLNRARQLNDLVEDSKKINANNSIINFYLNLLNITSVCNSEIDGFWSFNYTDSLSNINSIKDFSDLSNNLSTKSNTNLYTQEYLGLLSTVNIKDDEYFYLNEVPTAFSSNPDIIELGDLINHVTEDKYVWSNGLWYSTTTGVSRTNEYFKSNICNYYLKANDAKVTKGNITLSKKETGEIDIKSKGFCHTWTYDNSRWTNELGTSYNIESFKSLVVSYTGSPRNGDIIALFNNGNLAEGVTITLTGKQFDLLNKQQNGDCPIALIACLQHNMLEENNTILAQTDYFNNVHNFEIAKTERNGISIKLFTDRDRYIIAETEPNVVTKDLYSLIITYNGNKSNPVITIFINGNRQRLDIENVGYIGMSNNKMQSTSYINDKNNNVINCINSKVGLITLIKNYNNTAALTEEQIKCITLALNSLCGKNVYYKV